MNTASHVCTSQRTPSTVGVDTLSTSFSDILSLFLSPSLYFYLPLSTSHPVLCSAHPLNFPLSAVLPLDTATFPVALPSPRQSHASGDVVPRDDYPRHSSTSRDSYDGRDQPQVEGLGSAWPSVAAIARGETLGLGWSTASLEWPPGMWQFACHSVWRWPGVRRSRLRRAGAEIGKREVPIENRCRRHDALFDAGIRMGRAMGGGGGWTPPPFRVLASLDILVRATSSNRPRDGIPENSPPT